MAEHLERALNIAVNTRLLLHGRLEGIGRFGHEILRRVCTKMPDDRFVFLFDRDFHEDFIYNRNVVGHSVFPQARHPLLYTWWFEYALPKKLKELRADLFFSPEGYLSLKTKVPSINVMHDINFEHHPEMHGRAHLHHFKKYFPKYALKAKEIITVSDYSKQDIMDLYGVEDEKVNVVYNGVSDAFMPLEPEEIPKIKTKWSNGLPYFVFIGSIHPRKNLVRLLQAFDRFKEKSDSPHQLLIVGKKAFMNEELERTYREMAHQKDVIFTGRLEEDDMIQVLSAAEALTFVPVFEGFGMPVIEAYKCGVPVITSDITSLPEIAGKASLLVDPLNIDLITDAMLEMAMDSKLRNRMAKAGLKRAQEFSWDMASDQVVEILRRNLGQA